ncbi:MAG: hypothetical protein ACRCXN_01000, partial [Bacteroidales bacterium]
PNNMEIADNNEVYDLVFHISNALEQQIFTQTVTVENLLKFKESDLWDESMNAIHVEYCGGIPFCIIPNDDCGGNTGDCVPFMQGASNKEDFQIYADNAALEAAWPWEIKNVNLISMIGIQGTSDKYVYVKGNQQGEITWKSQQFKFTKGDKILIDAAIRKLNSDDTPANPGGASFDAWLKVNLIDENGKKVGTEWKQKMQSNKDFALQTFEVIRKNTGTGCYRLAITLDMQSGKQERFEFKMDNIKIVK